MRLRKIKMAKKKKSDLHFCKNQEEHIVEGTKKKKKGKGSIFNSTIHTQNSNLQLFVV